MTNTPPKDPLTDLIRHNRATSASTAQPSPLTIIVVVFGSNIAMHTWMTQNVHVNPVTFHLKGLRSGFSINHGSVEFRCVVINNLNDFDKIRGYNFHALIEDESFCRTFPPHDRIYFRNLVTAHLCS